jgi:hypothetical protein
MVCRGACFVPRIAPSETLIPKFPAYHSLVSAPRDCINPRLCRRPSDRCLELGGEDRSQGRAFASVASAERSGAVNVVSVLADRSLVPCQGMTDRSPEAFPRPVSARRTGRSAQACVLQLTDRLVRRVGDLRRPSIRIDHSP